MKIVTFNPLRTIGIPGIKYIKPEHSFREVAALKEADVILFPENWQTTFLAYGLKKPIFPSIESIQLGYSKIEMTRALWTVCPENVPYTEILANTESNRKTILETFPFPFVTKEPRNSMGKGVYLIESEEDFQEYCNKTDVLYVQEYLPNDNRDLRVCIVGEEVVSAYWRIADEGSFLHNVAQGGSLCFDFIPEDITDLILDIAKTLNINHAGFDVIFSNGKPYIIEFNVLFGNQGLREQGIIIEQKIYEYLLSTIRPTFPTTPLTPLKGIS
ncbi:RimK family alpha-L-glutamate ligase [Aquibacillus koreensis]|uniref:RimK family alpha-L-glutamate ligase n=1 Tax=Aquibacillus koreensis TaxID=279446 RepID=A0A9X4AKE9_9BACI|nr:RimK family alpha-L-glutamate ligase [Aquibacillus koreensis]MCT2536321.1 RimK family alpha-L-glutamate ligase [Aquibacillus koreensis]MDC3421328.1 RimK family alpha-L-glutamate ligase [Aquibacillus koreensis]